MRLAGQETPDTAGHSARVRVRARGGRRPQRLTAELREAFLEALAEGYTVLAAAEAAGVLRRQTLYEARSREPEFAAAWDAAIEEGYRLLEAEADAEYEAWLASQRAGHGGA